MSWDGYFAKHQGRALRPFYLKMLKHLSSEAEVVIDVGCGPGVESVDLLKHSLTVHAVDREATALAALKNISLLLPGKLVSHHTALENLHEFPSADLIFSYHTFPFVDEQHFDRIVTAALHAVRPKGLFAATFFGPQDEWVKSGHVRAISSQDLKNKLTDFDIMDFTETEANGPTAIDGEKFWHILEIIAQKRPLSRDRL